MEIHEVSCAACGGAAEDVMYLHGACHPDSPTWSYVNFVTHRIHIECAKCGKDVMNFPLSPEVKFIRQPHGGH